MTGLSRRSLVSAAAALPALAVPAAVAAMASPTITPEIAAPDAAVAPAPDPIFKALARHHRLDRKWLRAEEEFDQAAHKAGYKLPYTGELARLKAKRDRAVKAGEPAMIALTKIQPTTPAGVAALVTCVRQSLKIGETPWHGDVLANVVRALKAMPA